MADNAFTIRGLMLDPARLTEKHDFYFELLPRMKAWGFNTLWWHFSDDEGCAQAFDSHPELAAPFAFTRSETARFVAAAAREGIEVVPELESLGHTLYLTRHPAHAHLLNGNPWGHNALCPSHPDTLPLLEKLIRETAALFPSRWFHAGLDEAQIDNCPLCAERAQGRPPGWLFHQHVLAIHRIVAACGKRMIMWADGVERHPELLADLPRDIVMAHWHYRTVRPEAIERSLAAGFEVVGVPAMSGEAFLPCRYNLDNVAAMGETVRATRGRGGLGMVTCWWESMRVLRDSTAFALAWAGRQLEPEPPTPAAFAAAFARDHFGIRDPAAGQALLAVHLAAPDRAVVRAFCPDSVFDLFQAVRLASDPGFETAAQEAEAAATALAAWRGKVERHREEFEALALAADVSAMVRRNGRDLLEAWKAYGTVRQLIDAKRPEADIRWWTGEVATALRRVLERTREAAVRVAAEWDRTRHADDEKKDNRSPLLRQRAERACLPILLHGPSFIETLIAKEEDW